METRCPKAASGSRLTLADVLRMAMPAYAETHRLPLHHWKALRAIMVCRTAALGGHHYECRHCGAEHFVPHSCRNRHCPTCQAVNSADWLAKQAEVLLPIPYFHLVFTLPHDLNPLIQQNQAAIYNLLFETASATLLEIGRNHLHAQIGVTAVLHTWSQTLLDHYHLHCIVTGGGLCSDGSWKFVKPHWLFPVRALSVVFRGKFRDGLKALFHEGKLEFHGQIQALANCHRFGRLLRSVCRSKWVVYAKRPFPGAKAVLAYLSRYTHRVGISNQRLKVLDRAQRTVTFDFKDYVDESRRKLITLNLEEFVRRLRLHLLPARFVKIRHFGLLANRNRRDRIAQARSALKMVSVTARVPEDGMSSETSNPAEPICPNCHRPGLRLVRVTHHDSFRTCPIFSDSS